MQIPIFSVEELGLALRAVRRSQKMRLDDMAALTGVSKQFASDVERGKETVRLGLVLKLLGDMGLRVSVDIPDQSGPELVTLKAKANVKRKPPAIAGQG
ncbi:MAG: helix-turn-helix domain-containing protein [Polaromonas sp.]|nr:helix-turn-helix domain-containing protein [Polaromonas sp.]